MADSHITSKIYSNLGIGKQVSSGSHLSVLSSKVEFSASSNGCAGGMLTNGGNYLQNKYIQLGTGNYTNHINNNNNVKEAPMNGQMKHATSDKQKYVKVHQQQQQGLKEDRNRNLVTEGWPSEPKNVISDPRLIRLDWPQPGIRIGAGLANLGNTCFMNTVIQCLTYCPPLATYLLQDPERHCATCKITSFCMMCELQKHIRRALDKHGVAIRPTYMYQKLKSIAKHFQPGRQEDAHEFLRYVIDNLWKAALSTQEDYAKLDPASKETTAINHIFGGYSRSQVVCLRCHGCSNTYDHFMDIILDIKGVTSLEGALEKFVEPEMLEDDNAYKCPKCNVKVKAQKKFTVYKAPNVATFQFKRFDYHRFNGGKITKHINYPEKLNLRSYMAEKTAESVWYRLNSVLVHAGHTCNSGHYYCYVRSPNNRWYRMDDIMVQPVGINQVLHQQAYVLFYVRVSSQKNPVKKPASPFHPTQLNPDKNISIGHTTNMNRILNNSPRPPYLNSHSCSKSRPEPPLTNGTLAPPCSKTGNVTASSKFPPRDKITFSLNKGPLVKVKSRPPDHNNSLPAVHNSSKKPTLLVPYTGDSSASTSDSSSEPERKQPKLSSIPPQSPSLAAKPECNGNSTKEESKSEKPNSLTGFERPTDGTKNRFKSTTSWAVSDTNIQSPSIASNSSNTSMNSTTMDWNVTEHESASQRNRNYNGWAVTPTPSSTSSKAGSNECLAAALPEPQQELPNTGEPACSTEKEEEEVNEASHLLPFRGTPQGGGGESKLCPNDISQRDGHGPWGEQQSSQYTTFGPAQFPASPNSSHGTAAATNAASSPDGKRKRIDPTGCHEESHRAVLKRHKDGHYQRHRSHSGSSGYDSNHGASSKAERTVRKGHRSCRSPKEERRKVKHRRSSSSSSSEEWEERTKDTIEMERKQRLSSESISPKKWDDKSHSATSNNTERSQSAVLQKLITNGGRGYGTTVNNWDGGKSNLDTAIGEYSHKKRYSDQYNEEMDRGKERKDRRRDSHPSSYVHGNPFQSAYDRRRSWNFNGQHTSWNRFSSNYHKPHHYDNGNNYPRDYYHHHYHKKYQPGVHSRHHSVSSRGNYNHYW